MPAAWVSGVGFTSLLAWDLTGWAWLAVGFAIAGMSLALRHEIKLMASMQEVLEQTERERAAIEQALHRSQKMEALGRLAVGVAHDFNNHLTVISSNVEMVARRLGEPHEPLRRHTEAAMQGVQRAAALTGRLLAFSHQPAPDPEAVDVDRVVRGISDLLRRTLRDRIALDVELPASQWLTWADVNQMENALVSLAVNVRDQARDGAKLMITVSNIDLDPPSELPRPAVSPGNYVQIEIRDRASGEEQVWLPADDMDCVDFSMAGAFANAIGGYLLRSDPSAGGISLRLLLPRYVPPARATSVSRRDPDGRPTILVVEDDDAVRSACVEILRELEYRVLDAPDAMEAFRLIADHGGIDLLFTDLGLPGGVGGRALADAARNVDAGIRVLFTTGYEGADPAGQSGMALLRKPFSPAQLAGMVRDVLADGPGVAESSIVQSTTLRSKMVNS